MPASTQSIREIVAAQPTAARILERFDIDLCLQAENSLDRACTELQLSVGQVLEKLADAEAEGQGGSPLDPATLSIERLIQHIVRTHHQYVRRELPRLVEMAQKLAAQRSDRAPELRHFAELAEDLRTALFAHIQKEEQILFPFVAQMDRDSIVTYPPAHVCFRDVSQPILMMMQEHEGANRMVAELRDCAAGFQAPEWACATHLALFAALRAFESDLKQHLHLENDLLFPRAIKLEDELNSRG